VLYSNRIPWFLILPLVLLGLWQTLATSGWIPVGIVPEPVQVVRSWHIWVFGDPKMSLSPYSGTWFANVTYSGKRVLQGFAIATVIGVPVGLLVGWSSLVAKIVDPTIQLFRPIPITAWVPFAVAAFGIYDANALFLISLGAFYPIVLNSTHGVRDTNPLLLRAAMMMGASKRKILTHVVFPSALPAIFTGLRLGIGVAWTAVVVAEMVAVKSGLGYVLWDAYYVSRMDICVVTMISIGIMGFLSDRVVVLLSRVVLR